MAITLIATGGTIASRPDDAGHVRTALLGADLLGLVAPEVVERVGGVEVVDQRTVGSWNIRPAEVAAVAERARSALEAGAGGVVVTHGTDTVEETAFGTWLLAGRATATGAIAFTCSMRHADEPGFEGPRNLADALQVAAHPGAAGRGPLLVANGEVHSARWVTKTHSTALSTFRSPEVGPVGAVDGEQVRFLVPAQLPAVEASSLEPAVEVVLTYAGQSPGVLDGLVAAGARGLVLVAPGTGNVAGSLVPGIERARSRGVAVVVTTRCPAGPATPTYAGPGGGASLVELGVVHAGRLPGVRARWALMAALASGATEPDAIRAWLAAC